MGEPDLNPERVALFLGLAFFFGLAFEELYGREVTGRPGGVRTFPLLALAGAGLYVIAPSTGLPFAVGLAVLGAWLFADYRQRLSQPPTDSGSAAELMVPVSNLLAYLLGPVALLAPTWVAVTFTVAAVLFLGARERLHTLARAIPHGEFTTLGKFLVLTGIVLPLLPRRPVSALTAITPYQVWLAVVVISTLSYASYLVQRYVSPRRGILVASVLGGLYSSTATTVVLGRHLRERPEAGREARAGIVLATALMYPRIGLVVAVFNLPLARALAPALLVLFLLALAAAGLVRWREGGRSSSTDDLRPPGNPLEISTALVFAALFVVVSLASGWVREVFGHAGVYGLAAVVGVTDIDPFVLSVAQGGVAGLATRSLAAAILVATASNDLLKAGYAAGFGGPRASLPSVLALLALAAAGLAVAFQVASGVA